MEEAQAAKESIIASLKEELQTIKYVVVVLLAVLVLLVIVIRTLVPLVAVVITRTVMMYQIY